jgi:putative Holliday junction resolvase
MPSPAAHDSFIAVAFDFGRRRIGVAAGDSITRRARPVTTLRSGSDVDWKGIERLVGELKPAVLVVGLPMNDDGTPAEVTGEARRFARELEQRHRLRTVTVDERLSSVEASAQLREARQAGRRTRRVRKEDIDAAAACVILERWFNERSCNESGPPT